MTEQLLDVKGMVRLLRRSWRTVAVVSVICVVLAAGFGLTRPSTYKAKALVLLPGGSDSTGSTTQSANTITTDAQIATSAAVLLPAGRKVNRFLSLTTLQHRVSASASATASVLTIVTTGTSARETEALANAVAGQLVSFVTSTGSVASSGAVTGLQAQVNQLNGQLTTLQKEINTVQARMGTEGAGARRQDTTLFTEYTSEQTDLQLQLNSVRGQISATELGQVSANQGTQVIEQATNDLMDIPEGAF